MSLPELLQPQQPDTALSPPNLSPCTTGISNSVDTGELAYQHHYASASLPPEHSFRSAPPPQPQPHPPPSTTVHHYPPTSSSAASPPAPICSICRSPIHDRFLLTLLLSSASSDRTACVATDQQQQQQQNNAPVGESYHETCLQCSFCRRP